eukprot:gene8848-18330_t
MYWNILKNFKFTILLFLCSPSVSFVQYSEKVSTKLDVHFKDFFLYKCTNQTSPDKIPYFSVVQEADILCKDKWINFRKLSIFSRIHQGFLQPDGSIFDCNSQYTVLLHHSGPFYMKIKKTPDPKALHIRQHLISLTYQWNDIFSHVFSVGISMAIWSSHILNKSPEAKVLIPATGPFHSLLTCIGIAGDRIVLAQHDHIYFADKVDLLLRKPPFNVLQGHWPARALQPAQKRCIDTLKGIEKQHQQQQLNQQESPHHQLLSSSHTSSHILVSTSNNNSPQNTSDRHPLSIFEPRNLVIYLWRVSGKREAKREVQAQLELVQSIRSSLRKHLMLQIIGRERIPAPKYIDSKSNSSSSGNITENANAHSLDLMSIVVQNQNVQWIHTAHLFVRAVAVIGPHGGAFGNIFFCAPDTTVIEFNVPWQYGEWLDGRAPIRDLFYSLGRGIGIMDYWFLVPENVDENTGRFFYEKMKQMTVSAPAVISILKLRSLAS